MRVARSCVDVLLTIHVSTASVHEYLRTFFGLVSFLAELAYRVVTGHNREGNAVSIKLKDMQKNIHFIEVVWAGETATIGYKPGMINGRKMKEVITKTDLGDLDPMFDFMVECVTDWDLVDGKGQPVTVTRELIEDIPLTYLRHMFDRIMEGSSDVGEQPSS